MEYRRPVALLRQLDCLFTLVDELQAGGGGGSAGVSSFNSRTGTVTLGSGDVTGALGFTPEPAGDYAAADHNHAGVYSLVGHVHPISEVNGLQSALDAKQEAGNYAAASHSHVVADVTGLQTALDGKQPSGSYSLTSHNHDGVYAPASHGHTIANVTGLQAALDGKQAAGSYSLTSHNHDGVYSLVGHSHSDATTSVSGFMSGADKTKLNGVAAGATANATDAQLRDRSTHTGTQAVGTITGLATVATSGSAADLTGNLTVARLNGGSGASASTYWRGDGTWAQPSGGADPWTYVKLASDFTTSSATAVDVTGMNFTPSANTTYEFEAHLMCRTATATVGPRPGLAWPTGGSDGTASIYTPSSATAETMVHGNIAAALLAAVGGLPNTTGSYGAKVLGIFVAGASPSGTVKLQLASETGGTNVTIKAGSFLKYRAI